MNYNMRNKKKKIYKYDKNSRNDPQTEGRKPFDIYGEESQRIIEGICRIIESSISKGMSFDDVVERLLDPKMKKSVFLYAYIQAYKNNCAYKEHTRKLEMYNKGFAKKNFGDNSWQYLSNGLSDKEALERIYGDYLKRKKGSKTFGNDGNER